MLIRTSYALIMSRVFFEYWVDSTVSVRLIRIALERTQLDLFATQAV